MKQKLIDRKLWMVFMTILVISGCDNKTEESKNIKMLDIPSGITPAILEFAQAANKKTALVGDFVPMIGMHAQPGIILIIDKNYRISYKGKLVSLKELKLLLKKHTEKHGGLVPIFIWFDVNNKGKNIKSLLTILSSLYLSNIRLGTVIKQNKKNTPGFVFFRCYFKPTESIGIDIVSKIPKLVIYLNKVKFNNKVVSNQELQSALLSIEGEKASPIKVVGKEDETKKVIIAFDDNVELKKIMEILAVCNKEGIECNYLMKPKQQSNSSKFHSKK